LQRGLILTALCGLPLPEKLLSQVMKSVLFVVFLTLSNLTFAYSAKKGNITATLGPYIYKTNFSDTVGTGASSPYMGDFALIADGDVNEHGGLELGIFRLHKLFYRSQGMSSVVQGEELLQIDMGYRRWIGSVFSAALSFYSTYSFSAPVTVHNDFGPGLTPNTSAQETTLYGLDFSVQAEIWSQGRFSVMLNGIYSLPVTVKQNEKADMYGVIIGLRYFVQDQQVREKKASDIEPPEKKNDE
jgi:hypothetical protein